MSFATYMLRRIAATFGLFCLIVCACFLLLQFVPGTFYDEMRLDPQISPDTVASLRSAHGLSEGGLFRFASWTRGVLHGDLGVSFSSNRPVSELLAPRIGNTLLLTVPSLLLAWFLGVFVGVWSAAARGRWGDRLAGMMATAMHTLPEVVLCCLALLAAVRSGFFPVGGMRSAEAMALNTMPVRDLAWHMLLPVAVLTTVAVPTIFWHTRAAIVDVSHLPFVRAATAHGLSRRAILWRHILPVAANALFSLGGISIGTLLSASLLTEVVFAWPGMGPLFLDAITSRDPYVIISVILCSAALLIAGNLMADLALRYRNVRTRAS